MLRLMLFAVLIVASVPAFAGFRSEDDGKALHIFEDDAPVAAYNYAEVTPPEGVDAHYRRSAYFHPLYDLRGNVITEDFPEDHYHHRGVFWAWPKSTVGERLADVWALDGIRQYTVKAAVPACTDRLLVLDAETRWAYDEAPDKAVARETLTVTFYAREGKRRAMDVVLSLWNTGEETLTLRGSDAPSAKDDPRPKGYGGFCFRPRAEHKPFTFTGKDGVVPDDVLALDSPWADVSFAPDGQTSGVAILQWPLNPGFPSEGWILRHYAFLGASWPHREAHALAPGEKVTLGYRVIVHDGTAEEADIAGASVEYAAAVAATK